MIIGNYRIILKGTYFWSIELQSMICMNQDNIVKITNTIHNNDDYFFGILQLELFKYTIPVLLDKVNGNIGISFSKTIKYK